MTSQPSHYFSAGKPKTTEHVLEQWGQGPGAGLGLGPAALSGRSWAWRRSRPRTGLPPTQPSSSPGHVRCPRGLAEQRPAPGGCCRPRRRQAGRRSAAASPAGLGEGERHWPCAVTLRAAGRRRAGAGRGSLTACGQRWQRRAVSRCWSPGAASQGGTL